MAKDQNGRRIQKNVRRNDDGTWGATVWFGSDPATNVRRNHYKTRDEARDADISDEPGRRGCVRIA